MRGGFASLIDGGLIAIESAAYAGFGFAWLTPVAADDEAGDVVAIIGQRGSCDSRE